MGGGASSSAQSSCSKHEKTILRALGNADESSKGLNFVEGIYFSTIKTLMEECKSDEEGREAILRYICLDALFGGRGTGWGRADMIERDVVLASVEEGGAGGGGYWLGGRHIYRILLKWGEREKVKSWAVGVAGVIKNESMSSLKGGKKKKARAEAVLDLTMVALPAMIMFGGMDGEAGAILKACEFDFNDNTKVNEWWNCLGADEDKFPKNTQICLSTLLLALTLGVDKRDMEKYVEVLTLKVVHEFDDEWSTKFFGGSGAIVNLVARVWEKIGNYEMAFKFAESGVRRTGLDGTVIEGHVKPAVEADCLALLGRCMKREGKENEAVGYYERAEEKAKGANCEALEGAIREGRGRWHEF